MVKFAEQKWKKIFFALFPQGSEMVTIVWNLRQNEN
jgi:hypothetical protein